MISFQRWFQSPAVTCPELTKLEAAYTLSSLAMLFDEQITSNERAVQTSFLKAHGINRRDHLGLDERIRNIHKLGGGRLLFNGAETTLTDPIDRFRGLGLIIRMLHADNEVSENESDFLQALFERWNIPEAQQEVLLNSVDQIPKSWFHILFHFIGTQSRSDAALLEPILVAVAQYDLRACKLPKEPVVDHSIQTEAENLVNRRPTTILSSVRNSMHDSKMAYPKPEALKQLLSEFYEAETAGHISQCVSLFLTLHRQEVKQTLS